eukprot:1161469-Pelagomonas_calceolata.AAC.34
MVVGWATELWPALGRASKQTRTGVCHHSIARCMHLRDQQASVALRLRVPLSKYTVERQASEQIKIRLGAQGFGIINRGVGRARQEASSGTWQQGAGSNPFHSKSNFRRGEIGCRQEQYSFGRHKRECMRSCKWHN